MGFFLRAEEPLATMLLISLSLFHSRVQTLPKLKCSWKYNSSNVPQCTSDCVKLQVMTQYRKCETIETRESLTEGLEHPIGDAAGEGVEDGVRRVDGDPVLDACQGHALL